ncbi:MAG TPA: hypothetical protein VFV63_21875 [Ilumatobacteraceae bacterium]|nr:hypothetical protein [Ilumatobacteraceae bacterium]
MTSVLAATAPSIARSMQLTLSPYRYGSTDPTTWLAPHEFVRATLTPDGPGTLRITWPGGDDSLDALGAEAWGDGAEWLLGRVGAYTGADDVAVELPDLHPAVTRAAHDHPGLRLGASGSLYHELLPTIIAQRITSGEALRQWRRLCLELGAPAPGPFARLRLPPTPETLARRPSWWFHPLGIEVKRARAITEVASHAHRLWEWAAAGAGVVAARLALIRGVGPWTIGSVLGPALGDPDAVAVGDYHLADMVAWSLAGEPRATDDRMLELLEPFRGQRGRVIRLIGVSGTRVPAFGPRKRILPMHRW